MMSSIVMTPSRPPVVGDDRHDVEVVLRHAARHVLLVHRRRGADDVGAHHLGDALQRVGDEQIAQAHDAREVPVLVDDVHDVDELLALARPLLDDVERLRARARAARRTT